MSTWRRLTVLFISIAVVVAATAAFAEAKTLRERKIAHAMHIVVAQEGDPYVYGADGPNAFDCSGLTSFAFKKAGLYLPRTAADQYRAVRHISKRNVRRGDLMFFHDSSGHVYHVAAVAGRWHHRLLIWHAPHTGLDVERDHVWTPAWYAGTKRLRR